MSNFPEPDWKHLKKIQAAALDRLCARLLRQLHQHCTSTDRTNYERFTEALATAKGGNNDITRAFTDLRRSTAFMRLLVMVSLGVISDEELEGFSAQTRAKIAELHEGTPNIG